MNNIPKKWLITIGVVLLFLFIITNPSPKEFKDFSARVDKFYQNPNEYDPEDRIVLTTVRKRAANYLIYSIYQVGYCTPDGVFHGQEQYRGILMNFYKM